MKIDPLTLALYADNGQFLKVMECPLKKSWASLGAGDSAGKRCDSCSKIVHETDDLSDEEVISLLALDPAACLKVTPTQTNLTVMPVGVHPVGNVISRRK